MIKYLVRTFPIYCGDINENLTVHIRTLGYRYNEKFGNLRATLLSVNNENALIEIELGYTNMSRRVVEVTKSSTRLTRCTSENLDAFVSFGKKE